VKNFTLEVEEFFQKCIIEEHILPLTLWKVLKYHLLDAWFQGNEKEIIIDINTWEVIG
jgi:hypothetical protein